ITVLGSPPENSCTTNHIDNTRGEPAISASGSSATQSATSTPLLTIPTTSLRPNVSSCFNVVSTAIGDRSIAAMETSGHWLQASVKNCPSPHPTSIRAEGRGELSICQTAGKNFLLWREPRPTTFGPRSTVTPFGFPS